MEGKRILEVKDIKLYFPIQKNIFGKVKQNLKAVDGISFNYQIMAILDMIRIIYYQEYFVEAGNL